MLLWFIGHLWLGCTAQIDLHFGTSIAGSSSYLYVSLYLYHLSFHDPFFSSFSCSMSPSHLRALRACALSVRMSNNLERRVEGKPVSPAVSAGQVMGVYSTCFGNPLIPIGCCCRAGG